MSSRTTPKVADAKSEPYRVVRFGKRVLSLDVAAKLSSQIRDAQDHDIRLKLFNPRQSVRDRLGQARSMREFDIVTLDEKMALLAHSSGRNIRVA